MLLALLSAQIWLGRDCFTFDFFVSSYNFSSVSTVEAGPGGKVFAVDQGNTAVVCLNQEGQVDRVLKGGSLESPFFYATHVCENSSGDLFISDIVYGEHGNRIEKERIFRLRGGSMSVIREYDYSDMEHPPLQYGRVLELRCAGDTLYYTYNEGTGIAIYRCMESEISLEAHLAYDAKEGLNSASYDPESAVLVYATRRGQLHCSDLRQNKSVVLPDYMDGQIPVDIRAQGGMAYIAEVLSNTIYAWPYGEFDRPAAPQLGVETETTAYRVALSEEGDSLIYSDQEFIWLCPVSENAQAVCLETAPLKYALLYRLSWCACILWVLLAAALLWDQSCGLYRAFRKREVIGELGRILMVIVPCILVALMLAYSMLTATTESRREMQLNQMEFFARTMAESVDMEHLAEIHDTTDYGSNAFMAVKKPLDMLVDLGYNLENYYYYIVLVPNEAEGYIATIMDYEDSNPCMMPGYPWGDNEYVEALTTGEIVTVDGGISSYGSWSYTLVPLRDNSGEVTALLEVGMNFDQMTRELREYVREIVFNIFSVAAVLTMLVMEILFAFTYFEKSRGQNSPLYQGITVPIRMVVFLAYMTDSMQDGFIAILCAQLAAQGSGAWYQALPGGIAIALPMSMQLLIAALASIFGGRFTEKYGTRTIMLTGFLAGIAGFVLCSTGWGYEAILFGKMAIGFGQGLVYVSANTLAGLGGNDSARTRGFADVSAGVLSGVTIGVGLGSVLLSLGSYRLVYQVGIWLLIPGVALSVRSKNVLPHSEGESEEQGSISLVQFLLSRRVFTFFFFVLTPFMVALSFRDYVFPLYADAYGITEVRIGQIYLLFGLGVLYLGPVLADRIILRVGPKRAVIFASGLMIAAMGLFAVYPSLVTVILGVGMLYLTISFAYTCQYFFFETQPETDSFGVGRSFGVYSMFENIGQTIGPVIFGGLAAMGLHVGAGIIAAVMLVLLVLFRLITGGKLR